MGTAKDLTKWAFTSVDSPACFTNANYVHSIVRKKFPKFSLAEVEDVLQRIPAYTLHKARRLRYKRLKTIPADYMSDVQVDLADFQELAEHACRSGRFVTSSLCCTYQIKIHSSYDCGI